MAILVSLAPHSFAESPSSGIRVAAVSAPASVGKEERTDLRAAIERHLAAQGLARQLSGFTVSPALVQLRYYIEPNDRRRTLVCIVDLALFDRDGVLFGNVRGRVTAPSGVSPREVLDATARSAAARLAGAFRMAERTRDEHSRAER